MTCNVTAQGHLLTVVICLTNYMPCDGRGVGSLKSIILKAVIMSVCHQGAN